MNLRSSGSAAVRLCVEGTRAEYQGLLEDARALYWQAYEIANNDYEACIAAHYVARCQENPREKYEWNRKALNHANALNNDEVTAFYPSLYLNMGQCCELLGILAEAQQYYDLAASLGLPHQISEQTAAIQGSYLES